MVAWPPGPRPVRAAAAVGLALLCALAPAGAQAPGRGDPAVRLAPRRPAVEAGFHMEGAAELERVFGDVAPLRAAVDRLSQVEAEMTASRVRFSGQLRAALGALAAAPPRVCPTAAVAPLAVAALREGDRYRALGVELEILYHQIRRLDALGETGALTPDYRWRVNRVRAVYQDALADFRELQLGLRGALGPELAARRCDPAAWPGQYAASARPPAAERAVNPPARPAARPGGPPLVVVPARPVIFLVDNRDCPVPVRVILDEVEVGQVDARAHHAFRSLAGRHRLCLSPVGSLLPCGLPGTERSAYVHDGWSIALHCPDR